MGAQQILDSFVRDFRFGSNSVLSFRRWTSACGRKAAVQLTSRSCQTATFPMRWTPHLTRSRIPSGVAPRVPMGPQEHKIERRLAAIFAADVAGYSQLMNQDEVGTLHALTAHREIMDGLIADHGGRIANTAGDSVLAEFTSVVDAVRCATQVQQVLASVHQSKPKE